ncbi:MAG: hypothetical protein OSA97_01460 [Nevskia sp.]|nr:hypothetical protein [Nevskia sp.]
MDTTLLVHPDDLAAESVTRPNSINGSNEPLYDNLVYNSAGQPSLSFFQRAFNAAANGFGDTNMDVAGMLTTGTKFRVMAIELHFFSGLTVANGGEAPAAAAKLQAIDDLIAAIQTAWLEIYVNGTTLQSRIPALLLPPSVGVSGLVGLSDTTTAGAAQRSSVVYGSFSGQPFEVPPFTLDPNVAFNFKLNWPGNGVALPSGQNGRIGCYLRGQKFRNA